MRLYFGDGPYLADYKEPDSSASDTQPKGVHVSGTKEPVQQLMKG